MQIKIISIKADIIDLSTLDDNKQDISHYILHYEVLDGYQSVLSGSIRVSANEILTQNTTNIKIINLIKHHLSIILNQL
jgi:hypothetical protein